MNAVGTATLIWPPKLQMHLDVEFRAGTFATSTVGDPGAQGAAGAGVQGPGVRTPSAALVNAAVAGLPSDRHTPNGMMFTNGLKSMMFAIGLFSASTRFTGGTTIGAGATPIVHMRLSPITTGCATDATVAHAGPPA